MGRGMNSIKNVFRAAAVAGIVIFLVFAAGCSGDLLGYIKDLVAQGQCNGVIELPKTGQTTCYDVDGNVIPGSGTGQDGELQMGVAWPDPRFTDNDNGTITDNLTGLIWLQDGNRLGSGEWAEALIACNSLADDSTDLKDGSIAGDWRLPNRKELRSLVNYQQSDQLVWLSGQGFTEVQDDYYWSSTTYAPDTINVAWYVYMRYGHLYDGVKTSDLYVLAVRSGEAGGTVSLPRTGQTTMKEPGDDGDLEKGAAWPSPRFEDYGDGTICDKLTGLMWEQAPSGTANWTEALNYANTLSLGGNSDWRLPNVNELESLINAGQTDSAAWLNGQGFSGVQANNYWSSTTYAFDTTFAWLVDMLNGLVSTALTPVSKYVLAVRSGQ